MTELINENKIKIKRIKGEINMRVEATIFISEETLSRVNKYMERHKMNYRAYALSKEENGNIVVIGKKLHNQYPQYCGDYGVWTCWNDERETLNCGHYDLDEKTANMYLICPSFARERYHRSIRYDRCIELMTKFKDRIEKIDDDFYYYMDEECKLSEDECDFFGIDYNRMSHWAEYELDEDDYL